jgi:hypothetical protein
MTTNHAMLVISAVDLRTTGQPLASPAVTPRNMSPQAEQTGNAEIRSRRRLDRLRAAQNDGEIPDRYLPNAVPESALYG